MSHIQTDPLVDPDLQAASLADDPLVVAAKRSGNAWAWILAYGILLLVVALIVLTNPLFAGVATGIMLGLVLTFYGIAAIAAGMTTMASRARWTEILLGVLALAAGLFSLFDPVAGAASLVWAMGAWLLVAGILQLIAGSKARHDRGWRIGMGILDVILGLLLMLSGPITGLAFLALIVAISLTVRGIFLILIAMTLRKAEAG